MSFSDLPVWAALLARAQGSSVPTNSAGSDGSRVFFDFHAHFTVNANSEVSADFDATRLVCA